MSSPVAVPGLPPLDWACQPGRAYVTQASLFLEANGATDWYCGARSGGGGGARVTALSARPLGFAAPGTFALSARASIDGERSVFDAPALLVWRLGNPRAHWAKLAFEQAPAALPAALPGPAQDGAADSPGGDGERASDAPAPGPGPRDTGAAGPVSVVNYAVSGADGDGGGGDGDCGASDAAVHGPVGDAGSGPSGLWLCVSRTGGAQFAFHASADGERWALLRTFRLGGEGEIRAGFLAQCPTGAGCECRFEHIRLAQPPRNIRDGS